MPELALDFPAPDTMPKMNAAAVVEALRTRWPADQNVCVEEAPEKCDRSGRRIDFLAISTWRSRGLEIDAVEVKVSASDWARERERAGKADFWWRHSHRFWIAVPKPLAAKVKAELPAGWGLLSCSPGEEGKPSTTRIVVKAERRDPEPLPWGTTVGIMRAAANAGPAALQRAERSGFVRGIDEGQRRGRNPAVSDQTEAAALRKKISDFEAASGVSLAEEWRLGDIGEGVAILRGAFAAGQRFAPSGPSSLLNQIKNNAESAAFSAEAAAKRAREVVERASTAQAELAEWISARSDA